MIPSTVLHTEYSSGWGGQEMRILSECAGMSARGHTVMLACRQSSMIAERARSRGIEVVEVPLRGASDFSSMKRLRRLMVERGVDVVNTHSSQDSWCAGIAARFEGRARIVRTRHMSAPIKRGFISRFQYGTLPHAVVTTGERLRDYVVEQVGMDPDRVVSIPTGIDLKWFDPETVDGSPFRREIGVQNGRPLIGTVGMLRSMKGHEFFIDAAARIAERVPDAVFVIVGDVACATDIKRRLEQRIASLDLADRFIMPGYVEDIPGVMAALDVFVLPSVRSEGVPQVVSQAMAMSRPIVATDVGSVNEQVIDGKTGLLIEAADSRQIAESVLYMLGHPGQAALMASNARQLAEEKLSLELMLDATEALYGKLLAESSGVRR